MQMAVWVWGTDLVLQRLDFGVAQSAVLRLRRLRELQRRLGVTQLLLTRYMQTDPATAVSSTAKKKRKVCVGDGRTP
jgi:hypothetical protein